LALKEELKRFDRKRLNREIRVHAVLNPVERTTTRSWIQRETGTAAGAFRMRIRSQKTGFDRIAPF
jgi:hypothetical protein